MIGIARNIGTGTGPGGLTGKDGKIGSKAIEPVLMKSGDIITEVLTAGKEKTEDVGPNSQNELDQDLSQSVHNVMVNIQIYLVFSAAVYLI